MAHLIQSLAGTAKSVITLPLHVAKAVATPVLRRVGAPEVRVSTEEPVSSRPAGRVEPPVPPVRRTAEEAVAREQAADSPVQDAQDTPVATDIEDPVDRYDEYDEPAAPPGNAAPVDGAGIDDIAPDEDSEPLLDPSVAKAVRSEAETMRKAADPGT